MLIAPPTHTVSLSFGSCGFASNYELDEAIFKFPPSLLSLRELLLPSIEAALVSPNSRICSSGLLFWLSKRLIHRSPVFSHRLMHIWCMFTIPVRPSLLSTAEPDIYFCSFTQTLQTSAHINTHLFSIRHFFPFFFQFSVFLFSEFGLFNL